MPTRLTAAIALLASLSLPAQNTGLVLANGATDDHVDVAYGPGLLPRRSITVEAWMIFDDATMAVNQGFKWPTIARHDTSPGGESWFLRIGWGQGTGATFNLEWACHNGNQLQFTTVTAQPGQFANWTHVACTYDGSLSTIYLNGVQAAQTNVTGMLRDNQGGLRIGNGDTSNAGAEVWNGSIDELRIWPFARTAAEITATMNDDLFNVPGALSFNLNGNYQDTSSGFLGVPTGNPQFGPGPMGLTVAPSGGAVGGPITTTCNQLLGGSIGARAVHGSAGFSYIGYDASANTAGVLLLSTGLAASPIPLLGIQLNLDLGGLLSFGIPVTSGADGVSRAPLPLPNDPNLSGAVVAGQWVFADAACSTQGLTASVAIEARLQ